MTMLELDTTPQRTARATIPTSALDLALTAQLVVAWAGESGEDPRLGWWRSDLVSEFGGEDLLRRLLPATWRWAVLQAARETARRRDAELRRQGHDADRILSLFSLGFELDERLNERLLDLKNSGRTPTDALPGLAVITADWNPADFWDWVTGHGDPNATTTPTGRLVKGPPPAGLTETINHLVAALAPPAPAYPLPHYRRTP